MGRLCIKPGSHWENGHGESSNGKVRDEHLSPELFAAALEARVLADRSRKHYNAVRPHSALDYGPPAPGALVPRPSAEELSAAWAALTL